MPGEPVTHTATTPLRVVAFDRTGKSFLSAGDDKLVHIWDTKTRKILKTMCVPTLPTVHSCKHCMLTGCVTVQQVSKEGDSSRVQP